MTKREESGWRRLCWPLAPFDGEECFVWGALECSPMSRPRIGCDDIYRAEWSGVGFKLCGPQVDEGTWVCGVEWWMPLPEAPQP